MICRNCHYFRVKRRGRCYGCDRYYRAMGTERPDELIERAIWRRVNRGITERAKDSQAVPCQVSVR